MKMHLPALAACASAVLLATAMAPAGAVPSARGSNTNAVAACQGALPSYEGRLRKRPLAIANEGTTSAFISCGFHGETASTSGTEEIYIYFTNQNAAAVNLTCTLVDGYQGGTNVYLTKTVSVEPGQPWTEMSFGAADNGGSTFQNIVSFSCSLPARTSITNMYHYYRVDVGA